MCWGCYLIMRFAAQRVSGFRGGPQLGACWIPVG